MAPQSFSIIFFPEINGKKLRIPAHFCVGLQETVTLRDKYKNLWLVKAKKVDGHWYLLDGWAKFVADTSVTIMDVIHFNDSGKGLIDVNIFWTSGEVKEGVGHHKIDNPRECRYMESDKKEDFDTFERFSPRKNRKPVKYSSIKAKGKRGKEVYKYQDDIDELDTDDDFARDGEGDDVVYQEEVIKELRKSRNDNYASGSRKPLQKKRTVDCLSQGLLKSGLASKPKGSYSVKRMKHLYINEPNKGKGIWKKVSEDEEEEDDSAGESIELTPRPDKKGKGLANELRPDVRTCKDNKGKGILIESSDNDSDSTYQAFDSDEETSEEDFGSGRDVKAPKSIKPRKRVNYLAKELFESLRIPIPEGKYFVKRVNPKRMNELYIPRDIVMDKNLPLHKKMKLVDPSGNTYTSWLVSWGDERRLYKGGINRLCRRNHLTKDDFCICVFGEEDESRFLYITFARWGVDK